MAISLSSSYLKEEKEKKKKKKKLAKDVSECEDAADCHGDSY